MDPDLNANPNPQNVAPAGNQFSTQQPVGTPPPQNNKKKLLAILGVVAVIVVVGIILFVMMGNKKDDKSSSDNKTTTSNSGTNTNDNANTGNNNASDKFTKYDVKDTTGIQYSVSFYKGAKPLEKNSLSYLIAGDEGSQTSVFLSPATASGSKEECTTSGLEATTATINGQSTTVCYQKDNTVYLAFTTVNGVLVRVNVAGQKGISVDDAKAIMESVSFK